MDPKKNELDNRFQEDQTADKVGDTGAETGSQSFTVSETKRSGGKLKQEVAAQVVAQGKGTSGFDSLATPAMYGKVAGSYSGEGRAVLGNSANTPVLRNDNQGNSREGKKLSDPNKDINLMASEQYATYFEQPKALANDRESTVGYNGNPSNISARAQKNSGFTPAELTFDRSVDEIRKDAAIFVAGQTINAADSDYPTKTGMKYDSKEGANVFYPQGEAFGEDRGPRRGNYMPTAINVTFKREASGTFVSSFSVDEMDISIGNADHYTVNDSSAAHPIAVNRAELARQAIDNDHGSPTSSKYNPLGRSVQQPSATMLYLMDMEQVSGAIMTSALRFASKSKAYYLSRVGKDGVNQDAVAIDALYGHLLGARDSSEILEHFNQFRGSNTDSPYFSTEWNKLGSAAILLRVFDSLGKYKTKADLVNQPRGLKLPLSTGLNNHTPFHVAEEFVKALNSIDVFSTIDRDYDPSAPTMVLDSLRYILPYSWKTALAYTRGHANDPRNYSSELFVYSYQAGQGNQRYYIKVGEPILNGIAWFFEQYADSFYSAIGGRRDYNDEVTLTVPVMSRSTGFSLFDYLICAASAYILYERTNSMKDILDEEMHTSYPFPHMHSVTKDDILKPTNYGAISTYERLTVKQMKPADAMKWILPEVFSPVGDDIMLPWYFAQSDFQSAGSGDALRYVEEPHHFPAPVIRSGVASAYLDDFYAMSLKDQLLSIDKMSNIPGHTRKDSGDTVYGYFYKYGVDSEGIPVLRNFSLPLWAYLMTPRQIGWTLDLPYGVCQVRGCSVIGKENFNDIVETMSAESLEDLSALESSFRARAYSGQYSVAPKGILSTEVVNINRGQAFAQKWADAFASTTELSSEMFNIPLSLANGLSRNAGNDANDVQLRDCYTMFKPYVTAANIQTTSPKPMFALMRVMWARIQKLPFIINPFDSGTAGTSKGVVDPFDFAYMFGLAGFMSVTYFEELSNRMSDKYAKMFNFTSDPYFEQSPRYK